MSQFSDMANAFDRDAQRASAAQETEDVFKVLQSASTPVNPNPRRFVEPRPEAQNPEGRTEE